MIRNCVAYTGDGRRGPELGLDGVQDFLRGGEGFVWVGLHEPDEPLLQRVQEAFGLHDLAVEDAHHAHQRPKIESYGNALFIVVHTAQMEEGRIRFGETHVFLGRNYLITVRHGASTSYTPARARCEREPELLALGPSYGLYAVLDLIVDHLMPIVDDFQQQLRQLEDAIFGGDYDRQTIVRLYRLKRELVTLRLAVTPLQDILNQLVHLHPGLIRDETRVYLRDVYDHAMRIGESVGTLSEMLSAALSVNLALVSVTQGEVVKRLAGWAALLAVPTLIASWYGMNFQHMPELSGRHAYAVVTGVTVAAMALVYGLLRRARWL
ncbi:MAG: magnesium transporter CorA [Lysobacteraceae bacterium]|nr:MAG: magnesium transporter CorA [Xanthomonadaceae bacterium]